MVAQATNDFCLDGRLNPQRFIFRNFPSTPNFLASKTLGESTTFQWFNLIQPPWIFQVKLESSTGFSLGFQHFWCSKWPRLQRYATAPSLEAAPAPGVSTGDRCNATRPALVQRTWWIRGDRNYSHNNHIYSCICILNKGYITYTYYIYNIYSFIYIYIYIHIFIYIYICIYIEIDR